MRASKENARKMMSLLEDDWGESTATGSKGLIMEFLKAAERKLPSEESFDKETERDKQRNAVEESARRGFHNS